MCAAYAQAYYFFNIFSQGAEIPTLKPAHGMSSSTRRPNTVQISPPGEGNRFQNVVVFTL